MAADLTPDVALVDIELGSEDGLDLARGLLTASKPTPVILISAYAWEDLPELIAGTTVHFLPKTALSASAIRAAVGSAGA